MNHDHVSVQKRLAICYWQQSRMNRLVKVTSLSRPLMFWSEGFVTCYKFIAGRTLDEAERILGLKSGELSEGAYLHELLALPNEAQFELKGYSQTPDGETWTAAISYPSRDGQKHLPPLITGRRAAALPHKPPWSSWRPLHDRTSGPAASALSDARYLAWCISHKPAGSDSRPSDALEA